MDWSQIVTVLAVVMANLGTVIALYMHLDNKTSESINAMREDSKVFQKAMLDEAKDFHGRLCAIEERRSTKK